MQNVMAQSANPPTASGSGQANCSHPTQFFDQLIHHPESHDNVTGEPANATFKQQYQLITDYYKPGSNAPILFYQGAETTEFVCLVSATVSSIR